MSADIEEFHTTVLHRVSEGLAQKYQNLFSAETVERYVYESYTALARSASVSSHLVALAERFATDRLRALALAQGKIDSPVPQVLFVCVSNAGRSQIAAALLANYAGSAVEVRSAGSQPGAQIHPLVEASLRERDIDLTEAYPKPLTDDVVQAADYVITMGCGDACPIYPGKYYLDWAITDPADKTSDAVHTIIDDIDQRVRDLWSEIQR